MTIQPSSNRAIKFRVWIPEEKRFRYCEYVPTMGFVWNIDGAPLEVGENYPQQFTGLKDKNGVEIYEGDIVSVKCYDDWNDEIGFDVVYFVDWCDKHTGFRGFTKRFKQHKYSGVGLPDPITLLGNICETPDLLKS